MLALVKTERGEGHLELIARPTPEPAPGWVRIAVIYAGICGTDLHIVHDRFPYWPPVTLGHEFVGRVDAVGGLVDSAWIGTRVVSEPHSLACGTCHLCRRGIAELCASKRSPGWGIDGAFSASLTMPVHLIHRVPDGVPDIVAALTEPMAIAVTALLRARVDPGDTVLVVGAGPVGILAAVAARTMGAGRVLVTGRPGSDRLAFAATLGFGMADGATIGEAIGAATDGRGADLVIDASGTADGIALAFEAVKRRGRMAAIGLSGVPDLDIPWDVAVSRAIDLTFSMSSSSSAWEPAIGILAGTGIALEPMVTVFPLVDWSAAFDAVAARTVIKALLDPGRPMTTRGTILITDCDQPSIDVERDILSAAGWTVTLARCRPPPTSSRQARTRRPSSCSTPRSRAASSVPCRESGQSVATASGSTPSTRWPQQNSVWRSGTCRTIASTRSPIMLLVSSWH